MLRGEVADGEGEGGGGGAGEAAVGEGPGGAGDGAAVRWEAGGPCTRRKTTDSSSSSRNSSSNDDDDDYTAKGNQAEALVHRFNSYGPLIQLTLGKRQSGLVFYEAFHHIVWTVGLVPRLHISFSGGVNFFTIFFSPWVAASVSSTIPHRCQWSTPAAGRTHMPLTSHAGQAGRTSSAAGPQRQPLSAVVLAATSRQGSEAGGGDVAKQRWSGVPEGGGEYGR